jgi:electron transfer flavoprotein beta subunit
VKICVLVKEVPDAAVEKRMDPNSKRLDRSGEKNLNPFDTHAIEAAMQIREGGTVDVDEEVPHPWVVLSQERRGHDAHLVDG